MTDARFPERYLSDRRVLRLTADEFRGWSFATLWSVSNRTDGVVLSDELLLIPFMTEKTAAALVKCGLWVATDDGWAIADFMQTQTSRHELEVLENARRRDREKKARQREAKQAAEAANGPTFAGVPGDSPGGSSRGTSRGRVPGDRTGRTGRDESEWFVDEQSGEVRQPEHAAWGVRKCVVCGAEIPADSPVPWCARQDDEHNSYRKAA